MKITQTFDYQDNTEEMAFLGRVLAFLQNKDVPAAVGLLLERQDHLIAQERPTLKIYDQREQKRK